MRRRTILTTLGWPLLGLLAIAGMLMALGHREVESFPALDSFAPSGSSAFAELLRREGYRVDVDRRESPHLKPGDVAIVFTIRTVEDLGVEPGKPFLDRIARFVKAGGRALILPLDHNFQAASREAKRLGAQEVVRLGEDEERKVDIASHDAQLPEYDALIGDDALALWKREDEAYVRATNLSKGQVVAVQDGIIATNRFIANDDDAEVLSSVVHAMAPKGAHIVFAEAGFGNQRNPSLVAMLGRWAAVAWYQLLFLVGVIAFSLGKRFGMPEDERVAQRGSREMVDAIATTYRRGRMAKVALQAALVDADERVRKALRIPHDASEGERDRVLPEDLRAVMRRVEVALTEPKIHPSDALSLARELDRRVRESVPR